MAQMRKYTAQGHLVNDVTAEVGAVPLFGLLTSRNLFWTKLPTQRRVVDADLPYCGGVCLRSTTMNPGGN
jgi:hypothetical protein